MRQREHRVERVVVVEQHVGLHAVNRGRVRAAALARVLVDVDALAGETRRASAAGSRRSERARPTPAATRGRLRTDTSDRSRPAESTCRRVIRRRRRAPACAGGGSAAAARCSPSSSAIRFSTTAVGMLLPCSAASSVARIAARPRVNQVALQDAVVERRVGVDVAVVDLVELVKRRRPVGLVAVGRRESPGIGRRSA